MKAKRIGSLSQYPACDPSKWKQVRWRGDRRSLQPSCVYLYDIFLCIQVMDGLQFAAAVVLAYTSRMPLIRGPPAESSTTQVLQETDSGI